MSKTIHDLINEGEHQQLDFKFEISDAKKIARSLVAFANTDGGVLLIGVKDNGKIVGVRSEEEAYMIETAAHLYTRPEVKFDVRNHKADANNVLEIRVLPSKIKPHFAPDKNEKWRAYIRVKDENKIANGVMIKVWERQSSPKGIYLKYTETEKKILSYVEQYQMITFTKALRIGRVNKNKIENILANFIAIGILEPIFTENTVRYKIKNKIED